MKVDVMMPEMGESITEGTVAKWLRKPGDKVERDEALLEITTDKIDSEIPSPEKGVLAEILVEEGETAEVGALLARIETDGEQPTQETSSEEETALRKKAAQDLTLSPVAKKIAVEEGLSDAELSRIQGSGVRGKLTKEDLLKYVVQKEKEIDSTPEPVRADTGFDQETTEIIDMSTMRKTIAERMVESKRVSPHTYTVAEVDMTQGRHDLYLRFKGPEDQRLFALKWIRFHTEKPEVSSAPKATATGFDVRIYPNPVDTELYISSDFLFKELVILDISAKVVLKKSFGNPVQNDNVKVNFDPGLYFIFLQNGKNSYKTKIIIERLYILRICSGCLSTKMGKFGIN